MYRTLRIPQILILIFLIATVFIGYSCSSDDPIVPKPEPIQPVQPDPQPEPDRTAPVISLLCDSMDVYGGKVLLIGDSTLALGDSTIVVWSDDSTHAKECEVLLSFEGEPICSGDTLDRAGILMLCVSDKSQNSSMQEIKLVTLNDAPEISVVMAEVNVWGGKKLEVKDSKLIVGEDVVITWSDDHTQDCEVIISLDGADIKSGTTLDKAGALKVIVVDKDGKSAEAQTTIIRKGPEYTVAGLESATIYPDFNNANVEAYKRWGMYELMALAKSMNDRQGAKCIIYREANRDGEYVSDHAQDVLANLYGHTGVMDDIYSYRDTWDKLEDFLRNSGLDNSPVIITSSEDIVFAKNYRDLIIRADYKALKQWGNSENIVLFQAGRNVSAGENFVLNEDITDASMFINGWYSSVSAATNSNNIIPVESGRFKNKAMFNVYEGRGREGSCAYISKDNKVSPMGCIWIPSASGAFDDDYTEGATSFSTPALAGAFKNCFDICRPLGIVGTIKEGVALMRKYVDMIPATREDIDQYGNITENVDNGYVKVARWDRIIKEVFIPTLLKQSKTDGDITTLYKNSHFNIVYIGAGTQYLDNGEWKDTNGMNVSEYKDKPQRFSQQLKEKYDNPDAAAIVLLDKSGKEIIRASLNGQPSSASHKTATRKVVKRVVKKK